MGGFRNRKTVTCLWGMALLKGASLYKDINNPKNTITISLLLLRKSGPGYRFQDLKASGTRKILIPPNQVEMPAVILKTRA